MTPATLRVRLLMGIVSVGLCVIGEKTIGQKTIVIEPDNIM